MEEIIKAGESFQVAKDVEDATFNLPQNKSNKEKANILEPQFSDFRQDGICVRVIEDKICIYDILGDELSPIKASIATKDIFSPKTRNDIFKFIKSQSDETTFPKSEIHQLIDNFFAFHQKFLNLKTGEVNELKKLKEDAVKQTKEKKAKEAQELFEKEKPENILDLIEGKIIGKTKEGKNLREMSTWEKLFNTYSYNNTEYGKITIHLLIGQQMIESRLERLGLNLDPRINILYFKSSGTGGSAGFNIVADIAERVGLKCNTVASATDAAMVGSIEMVEDPETGEREPVTIYGLMDKSRSDILYFAEPEGLFEKNTNANEGNIRRFIQSGLNLIEDRESKLSRQMKHGTVVAECHCSILLATVPPQSILDKVIDSGFMQRFCFISKVIEIHERAANAILDTNSFATMDEDGNINRKNKINQTKLKEDVIKKLQYLKQWADRNREFVVRDDAVSYFNIQETIYFNEIKNLKNVTERVKEKMATFQQFTVRKSWQIAMQRAALRFSTIVEKDDIVYACEEIIAPQMESIKQYLEESWINELNSKKEVTEEEIIKQKVHEFRGGDMSIKVTKAEFLEVMSKTLQKSISTVYKRYKKYISKGLIIENKEGFVHFADEATTILRESLKTQPLINL